MANSPDPLDESTRLVARALIALGLSERHREISGTVRWQSSNKLVQIFNIHVQGAERSWTATDTKGNIAEWKPGRTVMWTSRSGHREGGSQKRRGPTSHEIIAPVSLAFPWMLPIWAPRHDHHLSGAVLSDDDPSKIVLHFASIPGRKDREELVVDTNLQLAVARRSYNGDESLRWAVEFSSVENPPDLSPWDPLDFLPPDDL